MEDFWKIVEVNTEICVPKYLKNVLMLYGYDDAASIESITMEDIDSIEEFVNSGIDEHIGDGEAKDFDHRFPNRKYQFIVTKGDRVKLMDVVEFVRNKLASEGGYKFFQQTLEATSSESLHSQELPAILFTDNDVNRPIKTESNLNDKQLMVSSTTGVLENAHDNAITAESGPTQRNQITSFSTEDKSDDKAYENLLVPLRFRTPSPSPIIFWSNENVKIEVENDKKDDVDFTKDCETTTSHLSKEYEIVVLPPNLRRCQEKIPQSPEIGHSSSGNKATQACIEKKGLNIAQYPTADVEGESILCDEKLKDENSAIKRFHCDLCGKIFHKKGRIRNHMEFHKGVKPHECSICGSAFTFRSQLERHLKIHTGEKPYVCDVCSKKFGRSSSLTVHKRIHTGRRFICDLCPKTYSHSDSLSLHKRIHNGEKPFVCDVCDKEFSQSSSLLLHKRIHTGERFACDVCPKTFGRPSLLSEHKRIHTGEKPFVCNVCPKAFRCSSHLSVHKRNHTDEKRYVCDACHKAFTHSGSLRYHKKTHCCV